jgi:glycosyltransferase involved in cell wall biosynthesis
MNNRIAPPAMKKIVIDKTFFPAFSATKPPQKRKGKDTPQILFVTSFPPRECGIATYSEDLIKALNNKFENSFKIKICALENDSEMFKYDKDVKYILNTKHKEAFKSLAGIINLDRKIEMIVLQHEYGFYADCKEEFIAFLRTIRKTKITVLHTVLPNADEQFKQHTRQIAENSDALIVMTHKSAEILQKEYDVPAEKITVIPHGTHLVSHTEKEILKKRYDLDGRHILSTFGLLGPGKSIETTLDALSDVIKTKPEALFLVIGKTHPGIIRREGEKYREFLEEKVRTLHIENHVRFINEYVPLDKLLDYLQLTDIYLFTSKDPNQAVSGTFSYAMSCGCAIISTPIPHAMEFLSGDSGLVVDFENSRQLGEAINKLLFDVNLRHTVKMNCLHKIVVTAWENVAVSHALLFADLNRKIELHHKKPVFNLDHIKKLTTDFAMIQFSKINRPDRESGYTLDDNARALIALCQHYDLKRDKADLQYISLYLDFIEFCQQADGTFLNYVDYKHVFTEQNLNCNLEDANGRAIWALGSLISYAPILPREMYDKAEAILEKTLINIENIHSPRAMAFIIKGLYYYNTYEESKAIRLLIKKLADRLTQMYLHESSKEWQWFESYLTYANSLLPEALLLAYKATDEDIYKDVAKKTFDFLLSQIFNEKEDIKVICNKNWLIKGAERTYLCEQPIDVAYTILALSQFYSHFRLENYVDKMEKGFEWFLGRNHLNQIIYNPKTGGCFDGLEEKNVNLNQGAESTVSYLLARLCMENNYRQQRSREAKVMRLKLENYAFRA